MNKYFDALGNPVFPAESVGMHTRDVYDAKIRAYSEALDKVIAERDLLRHALRRLWFATGPIEFEALVEPLVDPSPTEQSK